MTQTQLQKLLEIKSLRDNKEILVDYDKQESFDKLLDELIDFETRTETIYKIIEDTAEFIKSWFEKELNRTIVFDTNKGIVGIEKAAERCTILLASTLCKLENYREADKDIEKKISSNEIMMFQNFTKWNGLTQE